MPQIILKFPMVKGNANMIIQFLLIQIDQTLEIVWGTQFTVCIEDFK
jgi:hypothetical protein